jgi:hypothetical protein
LLHSLKNQLKIVLALLERHDHSHLSTTQWGTQRRPQQLRSCSVKLLTDWSFNHHTGYLFLNCAHTLLFLLLLVLSDYDLRL